MKISYFILLLTLGLLARPAALCAQKKALPPPANAPQQPARTELTLDQYNSDVHVQPLPADSTVVLLLGRDQPLSSKTSYVFQQYDQALHLRQESKLEVPEEFDYVRMCAEGSTVYALFSSRTTPELTGHVTLVSADALTDQRTQQTFFRAEIMVDPGELDRLGDAVLLPGMPVEAFIQTNARTPMAYLLKPFTDYFARAFRET